MSQFLKSQVQRDESGRSLKWTVARTWTGGRTKANILFKMDVNNRKSEPIIHIMQYFSIHHIGYPCSISHTWLYPVFNYSSKSKIHLVRPSRHDSCIFSAKKRDAWSKRKYNTSKYRIISYHSRGWIMLGRICIWLCGWVIYYYVILPLRNFTNTSFWYYVTVRN